MSLLHKIKKQKIGTVVQYQLKKDSCCPGDAAGIRYDCIPFNDTAIR